MRKPLQITAALKDNKASIAIEGYIMSWQNGAADFKKEVADWIEAGVTDAEVYINSEGGSVFEANEIYNVIKGFPGIITVRLGALCASAATIIMCAGSKVISSSNTVIMIHRPSVGAWGNAEDLQSQIDSLLALEPNFLQVYADKCGKTPADIENKWKRDWWMSAQAAKDYGFIDEIGTEAAVFDADMLEGLEREMPKAILMSIQNSNQNMKKLEIVVAALAKAYPNMVTANATEEVVVAQVETLVNDYNTIKEQHESVVAKLKTAEEALAIAEAGKVKALVTAAKEAKKITDAQVPHYEALAKADFENTKAILDAIKPHVPIHQMLNKGGAGAEEPKTYGQLMKENPKALEKLQKEDPTAFAALKKEWIDSLKG